MKNEGINIDSVALWLWCIIIPMGLYTDPSSPVTSDMVLVEDLHGYQSVTFNPVEPRLVALGGTENGTRLFDTRERSK